MSQGKSVQYTIGVKSEGLEHLSKLANGLDDASAEAAQLKQEAAAVAAQLQAVGQRQQAIDTLRQLGEQSRHLGNDLERSSAEVQRLGDALPAASQQTQALAQAQQQAAQEVQRTQGDIKAMQQALKDLRTESDASTRGTQEYKASVSQALGTIAELRQQLSVQKDAQAQASAATREAAAQEKALQQAYESSVATAQKLSATLGDKRRAMDVARDSARQLGVDSSQLAAAQQQVDASARQAQQGLEAVAEGLRRVQQRQAEAAEISQQFQQELRVLGLDGAQAPAGLEQAFKALGLQGVKKAEAAVHELQVALAQVRNSPDVLPAQKRAAVQAYEAAVAELRSETGKTAASTRDLGTATDRTGNALATAAHKAAAWGGALVGLQQLKTLAGHVVETGAQFENLEVRLRNLLGGTEAATQALGMLKELASSTPFDVAGLSEAYIQLTSFGMKPTEAQMRSLADITANLGGGTEALSGVTLALGQAWTKTKLQGEEILQLAERGVPVWDALSKATGRTVPELQRMASAGELGRDVIAKLIDELGRMNAGASEQLMHTYAGAVANAKDALAEFFDLIAQAGVLDWLTTKIRELLAEFERMKESGELQQKAQEIADAFLNVATMVDTAAQALVQMAPVLEAAAALFAAFKVASVVQSLWGMALGAGAATTALAATGAASAASAGQMTAAATAATGLSTALRVLRSLTGVGLVLGAAEMAAEFFRAKQAAQEADAAVTKMLQPTPFNGPKEAADAASQSLGHATDKTGALLAEFAKLRDSGAKAEEALGKMAAAFDMHSGEGIRDMTVALDDLLVRGEITAEQFQAAWAKALQGVNLQQFEAQARAAMEGAWDGTWRLQQAIEAGLREAIRRAGGDFEVLSGGMGQAAQSALGDIDLIVNQLDALKAQGVDAGQVLVQSLGKGISTADSQAAIEALTTRIEGVRQVLGDPVANGLLEQAAQKAQALAQVVENAIPGIQSTAEALRTLGVTSDAQLQRVADAARKAYEFLREQGTSSARVLSESFQKAAEAAIAANHGVAPAWVQAAAAANGYRLAVDGVTQTLQAKAHSQQASLALEQSAVRLAMEQQRAIAEVALARGDDATAMQAQNEIRRLEIELLVLQAQQKRAEAEATRAAVTAKRAELQAQGQLTEAKRLELEAQLSGARAKEMDAQMAEVTAQKLRDLAAAQGEVKTETDKATKSIDKQTGALDRAGKAAESQFVWTRKSIMDYFKQAGLDDEAAKRLSGEFVNSKGEVDYFNNAGQLKYGGKNSTLAFALGKAVEQFIFREEQQPTAPAPAPAAGVARPSAGPAAPVAAPGPSYVSNITLEGQRRTIRYADRQSQQSGDALLRELAAAREVAQ